MIQTFMKVLYILLFFNLVEKCKGELFTALADLEGLVDTEYLLINTLENYVRSEEQKLNLLKRYVDIYKNQHNKAAEDVQTYVTNPINAYTLIKRLTTDWKEVEALINSNFSADCLSNITTIKETMKFPTDEDLSGAAVALIRLQDTYLLDTSSLARGELNGVKYSDELSAADCFEIGRQSFKNDDYYHTLLWMQEADSRLNIEINSTVKKNDILEYLAFSHYKEGNISLALDLNNKILEIVPTHPRALHNKIYYERELQKVTQGKTKDKDGSDPIEKDTSQISTIIAVYATDHYKRQCRGEISLSPEKTAKLKCRYLTKDNPFLFIAPFKVEEAHLQPDIFIFHDVLGDDEIATIRNLAQPRFKRAVVRNHTMDKWQTTEHRISKSASVKENEHKYIADLSQRVTDMTGLSTEMAENFQVVNYGIGGHYVPHFDFMKEGKKDSLNIKMAGNRIATVLFYMSDVAQGGATVFPAINVTLWPKKGAAAFWYNLHPSGEGNILTGHAACPVLVGSKWVANKWIRERGQEFLRPCTLEKAPENFVI